MLKRGMSGATQAFALKYTLRLAVIHARPCDTDVSCVSGEDKRKEGKRKEEIHGGTQITVFRVLVCDEQ